MPITQNPGFQKKNTFGTLTGWLIVFQSGGELINLSTHLVSISDDNTATSALPNTTFTDLDTLPKTNSLPLEMVVSNRNSFSRGSIFKAFAVSFREGRFGWWIFSHLPKHRQVPNQKGQ